MDVSIDNMPALLHIDTAGCRGNNSMLSNLVAHSINLTNLDMSESRPTMIYRILNALQMETLLRSMDFRMFGNYNDAFNNHPLSRQHALGFDSVKMIIDKCLQAKKKNLVPPGHPGLSREGPGT